MSMSARYKEYGGGAATGLSDNLIAFLSQGLNTGTFGAGSPAGGGAMGQTVGIAGVLNDILSGGAGNLGGSMSQLIKNDTADQVNSLRARYGSSGGTAYGTGAQYAEGVLRSKQAPALTAAVGNLQLSAVQNLLGLLGQISQKGIAQRQGVMEQNPLMTGLSIGANVIKQGAMAFAGGPAGPAGDVMSSASLPGMSGPLPGVQLTPSAAASQLNTMNLPNVSSYGSVPTLFDYGLGR
jgi:hypothetical protein